MFIPIIVIFYFIFPVYSFNTPVSINPITFPRPNVTSFSSPNIVVAAPECLESSNRQPSKIKPKHILHAKDFYLFLNHLKQLDFYILTKNLYQFKHRNELYDYMLSEVHFLRTNHYRDFPQLNCKYVSVNRNIGTSIALKSFTKITQHYDDTFIIYVNDLNELNIDDILEVYFNITHLNMLPYISFKLMFIFDFHEIHWSKYKSLYDTICNQNSGQISILTFTSQNHIHQTRSKIVHMKAPTPFSLNIALTIMSHNHNKQVNMNRAKMITYYCGFDIHCVIQFHVGHMVNKEIPMYSHLFNMFAEQFLEQNKEKAINWNIAHLEVYDHKQRGLEFKDVEPIDYTYKFDPLINQNLVVRVESKLYPINLNYIFA